MRATAAAAGSSGSSRRLDSAAVVVAERSCCTSAVGKRATADGSTCWTWAIGLGDVARGSVPVECTSSCCFAPCVMPSCRAREKTRS